MKKYLESILQKDFSNANLPRIYIYLNRSETETLDYLIDNADNFSNEDFNDFLRYVNTNLNKLAETKKLFLDYECKLWKMLNKAEKNKEEQPRRYENAKTLLNKFINITV